MDKYLIDIEVPKVNNAGFKLRSDFNYFLAGHNYIPLKVWIPRYKSVYINLFLINVISVFVFLKYLIVLKKGSRVLIQYPLNFKYIESFLRIRKFNALQLGILINDLDSLRHKKHMKREFLLLKKLDYILSPNDKMSSYLRENGVAVSIINIGMYDYKVQEVNLASKHHPAINNKTVVMFAGNLKKNKSGFIYSLKETTAEQISFHLYGDNYTSDEVIPNVIYKGTFSPDYIDGLEGDYGLVWDGPDLSTCSGNYGSYLKLNNPHKTSLYLTAGLPIITWDQSAISEFISANRVGICVSSLYELSEVLEGISTQEYALMKANAMNISEKLKQGHYLSRAIKSSEALVRKPVVAERSAI